MTHKQVLNINEDILKICKIKEDTCIDLYFTTEFLFPYIKAFVASKHIN